MCGFVIFEVPNNCISCSKTRSVKSIHDSHVYVFNKWLLYSSYLKEDLIQQRVFYQGLSLCLYFELDQMVIKSEMLKHWPGEPGGKRLAG